MDNDQAPMTVDLRGNCSIGIDVGGTTIKAGLVDLETGSLRIPPVYLRTPDTPALPAVVDAIGLVIARAGFLDAECPAGVAFPAVIRGGRYTQGGLFGDWVGADVRSLVGERLGRPVSLINDADAAGIAEMRFGPATSDGVVIVLTIGTFIGSALFHGGRLVPNTELGQLEINGGPAELQLGGRAKQARELSWRDWASEFSRYLAHLKRCFSPELIVLAGGMTRAASAFLPFLSSPVPLRISDYGGDAGIVGAAVIAGSSVHV
jgi:polyphosphate glucokinase